MIANLKQFNLVIVYLNRTVYLIYHERVIINSTLTYK